VTREPIIGPNPSNREEWLAARRQLITATDIARIMRNDGFTVYHEKKGDLPEFAGNRATRRGNRFQKPTLEEYAEEANAHVFDGLPLLIDPDCPALAATPDAMAVGPLVSGTPGVSTLSPNEIPSLIALQDSYGVEAKTTLSPKVSAELAEGEEGSDVVPADWQWQTQTQMAVVGWEFVDVAILLFGKLKVRRIQRHPVLVDKCREIATEYADRIARNLEPPMFPDSEANQDALKSIFAPAAGVEIDLSPENAELWARRQAAASNESAAKKAKEACDAEMRLLFGNAEIGRLPDGGMIRLGVVQCAERIQPAYAYSRFYYSKPKKGKA